MPINRHEKEALVAEVADVASKALSLVASEYRGIKAVDLDNLRSKARAANGYMRVVKNTLAKRALEGTEFAAISDHLVGPLLLSFSMEDPGSMARVVKEFAKTNDKLIVKALAVGGHAYPGKDLDKLATLPTRDQPLSMLMGTMIAPITQLVRTLAEPASMVARATKGIADAKSA